MKQRSRLLPILGVVASASLLLAANGNGNGGKSPVQSSLRPLGLPVIGDVQLKNTDNAAKSFEKVKGQYLSYCKKMLPEGEVFTGAGLNQLDPQRLYFLFDYAPRVYFLAEGACYMDALGATIATVSAPSSGVLKGNTFTIFPNSHSSISDVCASNSGTRSQGEPLLAGDFVQLPTVKAGQQLAFFLMAQMDASGNPDYVYYNGSSNNPDKFQHLIAFFPDNSQYMIIGFEDMYNGGDKDCNDVLFVVDVGPMNAQLLRNPNTLPK
jgi:hypothetical protein